MCEEAGSITLRAPYDYNKEEGKMARVTRIAAGKGKGKGKGKASARDSDSHSSHSDFYPSISSLRSVQVQEEKNEKTCGELCRDALGNLYNFTLASCECFTCFLPSWVDPEEASSIQDDELKRMKEKLSFHFMNPFEKWKYPRKRRFPWKLLVQLASIVLVTAQLIIFARTKFALTNFVQENQSTFTVLFVQQPEASDGDDPLPSPIRTLYTQQDLKNQIQFTINQYFSLGEVALGNYGYGWAQLNSSPSMQLMIEKYNFSHIDPSAKIFKVSNSKYEDFEIITSRDYALNWTKIYAELSRTTRLTLQFNITTVYIETDGDPTNTAECFQFCIKFVIDNDIISGSMPINLKVDPEITDCDNDTNPLAGQNGIYSNVPIIALDVIVIISAVISILQCLRSILTSWILSREVKAFFLRKFMYRLKYHQILPLFNMWFLGVTISNILVLLGCTMKFLVSYSIITDLELVDITSIIIGLSAFGQWCGLLRFLSYFDKYNMLLITLRLSLPSVIRFVICTGILYIAFLLCGWLVLGPYHPKFRDPYVTSECLFSLINGDDMFATYNEMSQESTAAYIFSKIYLYIFIALFIYVVLSVFISLISDTYETLHEHWYERSKGLLVDFSSGKLGHAHYGVGRSHSQTDLIIDDPKEEEDYEYIRDASNRFVSPDEQPLIMTADPQPPPAFHGHTHGHTRGHPPGHAHGHTHIQVHNYDRGLNDPVST